MVSRIRLYIEGGGSKAQQRQQLKVGFQVFFRKLIEKAKEHNISLDIEMCGGNTDTIETLISNALNF